jgi:phage/plasmid-like protein (TIGR03299 family)
MSHNIDMTNDRANIAFLGSRNDIWHRLGTEMQPGMSTDQWAAQAGLNWEAVKVPAYADLSSIGMEQFREVKDRFFNVRSDNGHTLGVCTDRRIEVQPRHVLEWFERYTGVNDLFQLDVAGSLDGGRKIWATAVYRQPLTVGGDAHKAYLLMTTAFDGTGSTINQGTVVRGVCQNTVQAALADKRAVIRTRHTTQFNARKVGEELAAIAQGFAAFKAMGDAMAQVHMTDREVHEFFLAMLGEKPDAKRDDISSRKANQYEAIAKAYQTTVTQEGAERGSAWAALNAITRYVDHDRTNGSDDRIMSSSQFGSGAAMKAQAVELLMPRVRDLQLA